MKNLLIRRPYGRLGNFMGQIRNALQIGLFYKYNVILPPHPYFKKRYIIINPDVTPNHEKIIEPADFFYWENAPNIPNFDFKLYDMNLELTYKILKDCFTINNVPPLGTNSLLIHIRSGDIFEANPHGDYIMPPLSFYVDIIENNAYDDIYLVAEDRGNPCINKLLELYPSIKFKIQSLDEDIKLILGASNIVMTFGTFIPLLLTISDHIKTVYTTSYAAGLIHHNKMTTVTNIVTELAEYRNKLHPWKNTPEQREIMMTYKSQQV